MYRSVLTEIPVEKRKGAVEREELSPVGYKTADAVLANRVYGYPVAYGNKGGAQRKFAVFCLFIIYLKLKI